ncbi:MAG: septum formation initiator family protein [Deltaproteobacteria bacterium]|nr:septum formation initiator family protein [Deltaproteobacteria bacterium]
MSFWTWKKKKYFIPLLLFVVIIGLMTVLGDRGLIRIYKLSKARDVIRMHNEKIKTENTAIRDEIERLKNDNRYIEMVARKELGMVGKNEMVYQFEKDRQ